MKFGFNKNLQIFMILFLAFMNFHIFYDFLLLYEMVVHCSFIFVRFKLRTVFNF
jgi:hypothetical protein